MWTVFYDERLEEWMRLVPADIKARILRIVEMLTSHGPQYVREPYVKHIEGHRKLFEIRARGKDGIARVFYCTVSGQRIILLHGFIKKSSKTPRREIDIAIKRMQEVLNG
jgi:phage-related protein